MKRRLATLLLLLAVAGATAAQEAAASVKGYAFEQPRILAQQRLFGLAHGVSLLVAACMDLPEHIDAALKAYVPWRTRQEETIMRAQAELARHHFGVARTDWPDVVRALNLKNTLELAPDSAELAAACATLAEALARPRYDLAALFRQQGWLTEMAAGVETDMRAAHCRELLADDERALLDARLAMWREINAARLGATEEALRRDWPAEGPAASLDAWLAQLRRDARVRGTPAACRDFADWLKTPAAALRNVFAAQGGSQ